ncbi:MAG: hypothetical protein MHM6MM_000615 [Cercozoa sp. M6MM]
MSQLLPGPQYEQAKLLKVVFLGPECSTKTEFGQWVANQLELQELPESKWGLQFVGQSADAGEKNFFVMCSASGFTFGHSAVEFKGQTRRLPPAVRQEFRCASHLQGTVLSDIARAANSICTELDDSVLEFFLSHWRHFALELVARAQIMLLKDSNAFRFVHAMEFVGGGVFGAPQTMAYSTFQRRRVNTLVNWAESTSGKPSSPTAMRVWFSRASPSSYTGGDVSQRALQHYDALDVSFAEGEVQGLADLRDTVKQLDDGRFQAGQILAFEWLA